jgi:hypothetical protein
MLLVLAVPAVAQDQDQEQEVPKAELLIAPSFSRQGSVNLWGWHTELNGNWNSWAGISVDFSGHYFSQDSLLFGQSLTTNNQVYSLRGGPQFTFIRNKCCTAFVHGLVGGTWVLSATHSGLQTTHFRDAGFSTAVGPGLDVNINENLAWRVFQAEYSFFRVLGQPSNGFRISTGLVLKFY